MIYRKFCRTCTLFLFLLLITASCEKFSGDQTVPAYLSVDSIYLKTDYFTQGSASHKITDAWVYVDDEFLGAFELPARMPVLKTGKHTITLWSGVKKNGIAATRVSYPYYNSIVREVTLTPDSTTRIGTVYTTYKSTAGFVWREDFEDVGLTLDTINGSSAWVGKTESGSPLTFPDGNHSGMIVLDTAHSIIECQTHQEYNIPASAVYLEMNFNTSAPFTVGVVTYGSTYLYQTPVITLNPTVGQWKKIYIDLTNTLNAYSGMYTYRVYFRALKDSGVSSATVLIDNLKVVTYK